MDSCGCYQVHGYSLFSVNRNIYTASAHVTGGDPSTIESSRAFWRGIIRKELPSSEAGKVPPMLGE